MENDGRFPEGMPVFVRYPLGSVNETRPRDEWPWLPGTIVAQIAADAWTVRVDAPTLVASESGCPSCVCHASEIRPRESGR